ncbi:PhoH family protein [Maricaulis parjimensis]|uniref:PhoH family protein n=1 Tax=Maricaulis parjimensis TaxID=144023 RepID=UPI0019399AB5|nr:PhoH family protein [Maricaulis parjimensis]
MQASHPSETTAAFSTRLELAPDFAAHLRAIEPGLVEALQPLLAPYAARFSTGDTGVDFSGDEPAVIILQHLVEKAAEHWTGHSEPEAPWAHHLLQSVITDALQRDLAFRLPGLKMPVRSKTLIQHAYMQSMLDRDTPITIGIGSTGTGKTHLALAAGLNLIEAGNCRRLIITSPHIKASRNSDDPADFHSERQHAAIEDELNDLVGPEEVRRLRNEKWLQVMPLEHMRGRTFRNAFILVDEAQDLTPVQTRMVVTRLGQNARIVLTGDPNHVSADTPGPSGLEHLISLLDDRPIARVFRFTARQVVRNPVVAELEELYEHSSKAD